MTTILVVDDEFLIANVLTFALEDEGFMVVRASNGRKGLEVFQRDHPSLVITDFMMPAMNGLEMTRAIRELPEGRAVPIILMSGAQAEIARQHGQMFAAVFDKPFVLSKIVGAVITLIGRPDPEV